MHRAPSSLKTEGSRTGRPHARLDRHRPRADRAQRLLRALRARHRLGAAGAARDHGQGRQPRRGAGAASSPRIRPGSSRPCRSGSRSSASSPAPTAAPPSPSRSPTRCAGVPALAEIARPLAFALVVIATTYVSLIIGELVPKRLALRNAEGIAAFVSGPMSVLAAVGAPIVWFLRVSTEAVLRLLGAHRPGAERGDRGGGQGDDRRGHRRRRLPRGRARAARRGDPLRRPAAPRRDGAAPRDRLDRRQRPARGHPRGGAGLGALALPALRGRRRRGDRLPPRQGHPRSSRPKAAATCAPRRASRSTSARPSRRCG